MKLQRILERRKELLERSGVNRSEHSRAEHSRTNVSIPNHVTLRIPTYYRYFYELNKQKVVHVTAKIISEVTGYSISVIKQDFSYFGNTGTQGVGYNVAFVCEYLRRLAGLETVKIGIIIGAGRLGLALADYEVYGGSNIKTIALFDSNKNKVDNKRILHISELEQFLKDNKVDVCAIAVPRRNVLETYELITSLGMKNILSLSDVYLPPKDDTLVKQSDISLSLLELICQRHNLETE